MAIQFRRGLFANLDKSKLVAGEPVVALDNDKDYVGIAKGANDVIELATKEALNNKVIANPSGTATDSLTKLAIDGDIYNIEGGGGSISLSDWTQFGSEVTGIVNIDISSLNVDELLFLFTYDTSNYICGCSLLLPTSILETTMKYYDTGASSANQLYVRIGITNATAVVNTAIFSGASVASQIKTKVFYRNGIPSGGSGTVDKQLSFSSTNAVQNSTILAQMNKFTYNAVASVENWGESSTTLYSEGQRFFYRRYGVLSPCEAKSQISIGTTINDTTVRTLDPLADMVEANPSGSSSESLSSLKVGNTIYSVGGGGGTVDTSLSTTSTNAVQNKEILKAINNLGFVVSSYLEVLGEAATTYHTAGSAFFIYMSDSYFLVQAKTEIPSGTTISMSDIAYVPIKPLNILNLLTGTSDAYTKIQRVSGAATTAFTEGEYMLLTNNTTLYIAKALDDISVGDTITTSGNSQNVAIMPSICSGLDSMANYVIPNPSGTASTDLTKLEVGGTVYNIPSGGGTVDTNMSDSSTNALQNSTTFEQLNYFTYGGSPQIETLLQASQHEYARGDRFYYLYTGLVRPCVATTAIAVGDTITQLIMQDISPLYDLIPSPKNSPTNAQTLMHFSDGDYYEYTFYGWAAYEYTDFVCTIAPNYSQGSPSGHRTLFDIPAGRITSYSVQMLGSVHISVDGTALYFATPIGSTVTIPKSIHADFTDDITVHFWVGQDPDDSTKAALFYETDANVTSSHTINMLGWFTVII